MTLPKNTTDGEISGEFGQIRATYEQTCQAARREARDNRQKWLQTLEQLPYTVQEAEYDLWGTQAGPPNTHNPTRIDGPVDPEDRPSTCSYCGDPLHLHGHLMPHDKYLLSRFLCTSCFLQNPRDVQALHSRQAEKGCMIEYLKACQRIPAHDRQRNATYKCHGDCLMLDTTVEGRQP